MWKMFASWTPEETSSDKHTLPTHEAKPSDTIPVAIPDPLECPESLKPDFEEEFKKLSPGLKKKVVEYQDAIQPHTDEGGESYYIGDAYQKNDSKWAAEWAIEDPKPYLKYIKALSQSKRWRHLRYLAHWMEVTAAPPKWKFLRRGVGAESRKDRATRTRVCRLDYTNGQPPRQTLFLDTSTLKSALEAPCQASEEVQTRLLIVEDLSRDLVEMLGEHYDIDPLFFLSHINDYLFHNTRDPWVELPNLDLNARNRSHFNLPYLRPRYFENEGDFEQAEYESGMFNVLRRLDSDRSRRKLQNGLLDWPGASVTLIRAKTSVWIKPRIEGEPVIAILLVDPTVTTGDPLWCGNRPFEDTPSMKSFQDHSESPVGVTLFDQLVYESSRMTQQDLVSVHSDPKCIAIPVLKLVIADWLTVLKYMTTRLGLIEWEMEKPHWGENPSQMDDLMKKLAPWRRNIGYYQAMVNETIARLFPHTLQTAFDAAIQMDSAGNPLTTRFPVGCDSQLLSLWPDFKIVKQQMNECHARIMSIQTTATNAINIEESRRAVKQNKNLARLTFLATIFIPLNFTSSFLSMSPDFFKATRTVWLFFVLGIPITLTAMIIIDLTHPNPEKSICKSYWKKITTGSRGDQQNAVQPPPLQNIERKSTIPWLTRNPSSYLRERR